MPAKEAYVKRKPYLLSVKLEDIVVACSEGEARDLFRKEHPLELEGIGDHQIECTGWDKVLARPASADDSSASSINGMPLPKKK